MGGNLASWVDWGLTGLFVLVGVIMTFFILLQEGKGGGLAALGGTKAAGVEGVTNPIRRATAYLAVLFFALAVILGVLHRPKKGVFEEEPTEAAKAETSPATPDKKGGPNVILPPDAGKVGEPAKKDEPKAGEPKKDEPKKDEAKKDEPKAVEAKKDETKTEAPKTGEATKEAPKTEEAKKDEPKKVE
jgi:protein translocase SecG subunit